jgi:hypothetical protein
MRRRVLGRNSRCGRYEEVDDSSGFQEYITLFMVVQPVGNLIMADNEVNSREFLPYLFSSL